MKTLAACMASVLILGSLDSGPEARPNGRPAPQVDVSTPAGVLTYLSSHRRDVALVAYSVNADGTLDRRDTSVSHNADLPMPLASTIKIISVAVYAREVVAGRMNPAERVRVADWEKFYLPGTDGLAHPRALELSFGLATDDFGFAVDRTATVSLDDLVAVMLQWSDNAAADYLLHRLGPEPYRSVIRDAGLAGQQLPQLITGVFLSWANHDMPDPSWADVSRLLAMRPSLYAAHVSLLSLRYADDEAWRSDEIQWLGTLPNLAFDKMSLLANELFPRGTARDYASIMARVMTDTFISPAVSSIMRRQLDWPLRYVAAPFTSWGHKGGSLAGVLTDANFFVPSEGPYAGRRRVAVLFLRNMPEWASMEFAETAGQSLFDRAVAGDPAFAAHVADLLGSRRAARKP